MKLSRALANTPIDTQTQVIVKVSINLSSFGIKACTAIDDTNAIRVIADSIDSYGYF